MSIEMIEVEEFNQGTQIKVIGVGGGGGNAVEHMISRSVQGVEFICANTDAQALKNIGARTILQLGTGVTKGLGAGANPEVGRQFWDEILAVGGSRPALYAWFRNALKEAQEIAGRPSGTRRDDVLLPRLDAAALVPVAWVLLDLFVITRRFNFITTYGGASAIMRGALAFWYVDGARFAFKDSASYLLAFLVFGLTALMRTPVTRAPSTIGHAPTFMFEHEIALVRDFLVQ